MNEIDDIESKITELQKIRDEAKLRKEQADHDAELKLQTLNLECASKAITLFSLFKQMIAQEVKAALKAISNPNQIAELRQFQNESDFAGQGAIETQENSEASNLGRKKRINRRCYLWSIPENDLLIAKMKEMEASIEGKSIPVNSPRYNKLRKRMVVDAYLYHYDRSVVAITLQLNILRKSGQI